ncbi:MAG: DedA family protein [Puniceicoccales bacterium]|jgi:membrane protein DedA with SNARE-associated domain|nr:DedA family protein [Puniceicoccales bacterium]
MSDLANIIKDWGYLAVFLGSMIEGEVIVITAAAFAAYKFMSISMVFLVSFISTVLTDQGLFWLGRKMGTDWVIQKFPRVKKVVDRIYKLLHRLGGLFIFSFRFIYGIRMASPLILGAAGINPLKFVIYNLLSGATWAMICCFVGYITADVVMDGRFDAMPAAVAISLLVILGLAAIALFRKTRKKI